MRRLNMLRWRLARWIAPDPIVAAPTGDAKVYIYLTPEPGFSAWVETSTFDMTLKNEVRPIADEFALGTYSGPKGTFSGTVGA